MGRRRNGRRKAATAQNTRPLDSLTRALTYENKWVVAHFGDLVKQYPHKIVAVVDHAVAGVGATADEAISTAEKKHPSAIPLLVSVPSEEDIKCFVLLSRTPSLAPIRIR